VKKQLISYLTKTGSIASTTIMGATLMASNAPFVEHNLEIGGALGFGIGGLIAYGIGELEKKRQVLPIIGIGLLLANGGYQQGAKWWHNKELAHELQKPQYSYQENKNNLSRTHYDSEKYNKAKNEYLLSINKSNSDREQYLLKVEEFKNNKERFISKKTKYLFEIKYDSRGHRTAMYNKLIAPYIKIADKYQIILPPSGKRGSKADYEAIRAIAKVMYAHELNKLKANIPKEAKINYPQNVKELSLEHINSIRQELQKAIEKDIQKAKGEIDSLEDLQTKAWVVGIFTEVILAPILLWFELLGELPNPFRRKTATIKKERKEVIEHSLDIKKEDIAKEIKDIKEVLKEKGFKKIPKKLEQILHVALEVFANDLNKMVVIKAKKKNETRLILFNSYQDKIRYLNKERDVNFRVVNKNLYIEKGVNMDLFPKGDSFKKPFNETIRFLKWLTLNVEFGEKVSFEALQNIIIDSYREYK
jgi:hypothetical protein